MSEQTEITLKGSLTVKSDNGSIQFSEYGEHILTLSKEDIAELSPLLNQNLISLLDELGDKESRVSASEYWYQCALHDIKSRLNLRNNKHQ
jgi:hypothetical protein